jgi:uncharacterized protein (DUF1684 family)
MTIDTKTFVAEIKEWQAEKEEQLRSPDGWLTLVGLDWLEEGKNSVGSGSDCKVKFPANTAPESIGTLTLENEEVTIKVNQGIIATVNGNPITKMVLEPDTNRNPDVISVGEIKFHLIKRGSRIGIRSKHPNSSQRLNFTGRNWWLIDKNFRVKAKILPYTPQKMVRIPDVLGDDKETAMDCQLSFSIHRQNYTLDAFALPSGQFYILFRDQSCGKGSYPSGRFLVTEFPEDDQVIIDFNKAHNPPCAFTPFATCPLPPPQNHLAIVVQAGERYVEEPGYSH